MAGLSLTPDELASLGKTLLDDSGTLQGLVDKIKTTVSTIDAGWQGLANQGFMGTYEEMKPTIEAFPGLIEAIGAMAQGAGETFGQVDTELQSKFSGG